MYAVVEKVFEIFRAFTDVTLITKGITKIMILFMRIERAKPYS